jgi:gliding motility-associated-like protein
LFLQWVIFLQGDSARPWFGFVFGWMWEEGFVREFILYLHMRVIIFTLVFLGQFFTVLSQFGNACQVIDSTQCYNSQPFPPVTFSIAKKYESVENTTVYHGPLLADIDGDCVPEIIMPGTTNFMNGSGNNSGHRLTSGIRVLNSLNGQTISNIPTAMFAWSGASSFVIGDFDADGTPEFILAAADHTSNPANHRGRLICYDFSGNILWISNTQFGLFAPFKYGGTPALADFNQDGIPEVYIYNEIFNAQTGAKLCDGGNNGIGQQLNAQLFGTISITIAGNFDNDPTDLELAAGYSCYKVNITNPNGTAGNSMTAMNITVDGQLRDGYTSFADINQDGKLDIIVSSPVNTTQIGLYVYTINNGIASLIAGTTLPSGGGVMPDEIGPAFVGDIDGSGEPTIGVTRPYRLLTYKFNGTTTLQLNWQLNTNDFSGQTGMTMFDFNQDGVQEIVYRDETTLRIINGAVTPPLNLASFPCFSGTAVEHPIIGDIDNTGEAKICVTCGTSNTGAGSFLGKMVVFSSAPGSDFWSPARGIWNQYQYHVLNVNDDLTIPQYPLNNATFINGSLNNFYVQSSWLNNNGEYLWGTADLFGEINCIEHLTNNQLDISFTVGNHSSASLATVQPFQVSFFDGNPAIASSTLLYSMQIPTTLNPGDELSNLSFTIPNTLNSTSIYMLVNNITSFQAGNTIDSTQFTLEECDYDNNIALYALPQIQSVADTICSGQSVNYHGQAFSSAGTYDILLQNQQGCDSIVFNLTLTVLQNMVYDTIHVEACNAYEWFGQMLYASGQYEHLVSGQQCDDSVFVLQLLLDQPLIQHAISSCDSVFFQNSWVYQNEIFTESFPTLNLMCDSVVQTQIHIFSSTYDTLVVQSCNAYQFENNQITSSGIYDLVNQNAAGCNNYLHLDLTIVESFDITDFITVCGSLNWGSQSIDQSGIYTQTFMSQLGCDSLVTLYVTVNPVHEMIQNRYTCDLNDLAPEYLYFTNSYGCDSVIVIQPVLYPQHLRPVAAFAVNPNPIDIESIDALTITNLSTNALYYHWQIPEINFASQDFNPTGYNFTNTGQYSIYLTVSDDFSCYDSTQVLLFIQEDILVYVPNTFTPDGDAFNNIFLPIFSGPLDVYNYELLIFNRWGELIFESLNPAVGWDGTYAGTIPVQDGTYVWKIKFKSNFRTDRRELIGHVNVLR